MMRRFITMVLFVLVCLSSAFCSISSADDAQAALREAEAKTEQLAFEREERVSNHLERAGRHLSRREFELALEEYESVLEIVPEQRDALAGIRRLERERARYEREVAEKERLEQERAERERILEEARIELEREKQLKEESQRERQAARESRIADRRRTLTREERIAEHLRAGMDSFKRENFSAAAEEWSHILELTDRSHPSNQRAREWIESARRMEMVKREIEVRKQSEIAIAGVPKRVLETWTYRPAQERWEEIREDVPEEVITPARQRLMERAEQTISVDFQTVHIRDVLRELSRLTGINIVLDDSVFPPEEDEEEEVPDPAVAPPAADPADPFQLDWGVAEAPVREADVVAELVENPNVTMLLRNIPMVEALDVILRTKGLNFRMEDHFIWITGEDKLAVEGDLVTRTYRPSGGLRNILNTLSQIIPFQYLPGAGAAAEEDAGGGGGGGVTGGPASIIPGSRLSFDRVNGMIIITHTEFYHRLAEDIIRRLSEQIPQVNIETKFIDVTTGTLRQIGMNLENIEPFTDVMGTDRLGISFRPNLTGTGDRDRGIFMRYHKFTPTQFEAVLQAFEETSGANLLSAPSVTVLNNHEATIEVGNYFPFVSSYTIRDSTFSRTVGTQTVTFTQSILVPSATEQRRVGVYLRVVPGIGADRRRINLILMPEVTDFVGFQEYGITPTVVRSPIFATRYLHTSVDINDGETIVLGGLISGTDATSLSTVPVLGEVPVLGGLFRRRRMDSSKRELLIFVTARIIEPSGVPLVMD